MAENEGGSISMVRPVRKRKTKRRSAYVIGLVVLASLVLGIWFIARLTVCWGGGGSIGADLTCNGYLVTLVMLLAAVVFLILVHHELYELHMVDFEGKRVSSFRAVAVGNSELQGMERALVAIATLLGLGMLLAFILFLFLTAMSL